MITVLTVGGNAVNTVSVPLSPGARSIEWNSSDAVAMNVSPFTGQTQTFAWPGADGLSGTVTMPPMTLAQADAWEAFLLECRGMSNPFLMSDPLHQSPRPGPAGTTVTHGAPVIDMSTGVNGIGTTALATKGWTPGGHFLLQPGDYLQIGYRLHRNINMVTADGTGASVLSIWPSLRDLPTDGEAIILAKPKGLFRLATNKRTWSRSISRLTALSFPIMEYR